MKLLSTSIFFLGWVANDSLYGFAPSVQSMRRLTSVASQKVGIDQKVPSSEKTRYCIPLDEISLDDLPKVGGKTASLGEMIQQLTPLGVAVPGGFGVTSAGKRNYC
jgi:pyruvate,water dikinase